MLAWSVETFASMPEITILVVTTEAEFVPSVGEALVKRAAPQLASHVIVGGSSGKDSVRLALAALAEHARVETKFGFVPTTVRVR